MLAASVDPSERSVERACRDADRWAARGSRFDAIAWERALAVGACRHWGDALAGARATSRPAVRVRAGGASGPRPCPHASRGASARPQASNTTPLRAGARRASAGAAGGRRQLSLEPRSDRSPVGRGSAQRWIAPCSSRSNRADEARLHCQAGRERGAATEQALRDFERAHGLSPSTEITERLVKQLTQAARGGGH